MKTRLYLPEAYVLHAELPLPPEAAHYLTRVLRLKRDDTLEVFDGQGGVAHAKLIDTGKRSATVRIIALPEAPQTESPLTTCLAQGISRGERMDWTLQKASELGVSTIQPLFTERVEVKLKGDKLGKKLQHWQQVVISACEQSGRNLVPQVLPPLTLGEWLRQFRPGLVLDPYAEQPFSAIRQPPEPLNILVGPEGGLTPEEVIQARDAGLTAVRLGPRILRTETAGCALLAAAQSRWGDF
ncbi:16S rRNA m(3)U-1498 methyltransferase [Sulfurivirga caldicuralii]|uniref:Ribosomal RNA small subunit methyltransferase E n=1 Tax=Sulfurivirga caldicuralii TaxID=364032 RepID=A0A1N6DTJ7_9GAMM|nr:16S rRNA (uracil(1498)-N(3))-methyltransferase [Sulfurivirga caldicuralii]SIN74017.1 16S rRNA m(3)U-1498 methyltransferase [Sulfurivirga caldicuralii]